MKVKEIMESNKKIIIDKTTSEYKEEVKKMINFLKIWKPQAGSNLDIGAVLKEENEEVDNLVKRVWNAFK